MGKDGVKKKGRRTQIIHINPWDLYDCRGGLVSSRHMIRHITEHFPSYQRGKLLSSPMLMLMKLLFSFPISFSQYKNHEMGLSLGHTSSSHRDLQPIPIPLCIFSVRF